MPRAEEVNFTAIESPSLQFLPRRQEAPGWQLSEDPIVIPGDHLASYLDQQAVHFQRYETLDLTVGKYTSLASPDEFAVVEMFRFPDFVKAFGAYSFAKSGAMQPLSIVNESFRKPHSVHVWRGPFYIRITGAAQGDGIVKLATFIADRMPPAPGKPAVFNFFPPDGRVPNSERYNAESALGQSYLANSFQATFNIGGDVIDGIIIPSANKNSAAQILAAYKSLYVRNGRLLDPIPNLGEDNFTAEDRYLGRTVAFRIDRFLIAFNGYKDRQHLLDLASATDQRILGTIRKQLVRAANSGDNTASSEDGRPAWMQKP